MPVKRGLALILVVGVLGVLAVLGSAFAILSRLERTAARMRVQGTRASLLARSGVEDAMARLALGQDFSYGGENWDADANQTLSAFEAGEEVYRVTGTGTSADILTCPVRHAMRPSFFARALPAADPDSVLVGGKRRGLSGRLTSGNWALKVEDQNGRIFINGGSGNDVTMDGPNGFLVRLLDNLDTVVTGGNTLGQELVGSRPASGYARVEDLKGVLSAARYAQFKNFLTADAWVDPKVVKPQPMDSRPNRWLDVDDAHKNGSMPAEVAGVHADATTVTYPAQSWAAAVTAPVLTLNPGISGSGTEASPWTVSITATNRLERSVTYPVKWERGYVYAARQLRLSPPEMEPRAPVSLNTAGEEVLAAAFMGLKGTFLETWDSSAGWDDGWSWFNDTTMGPQSIYPYPDPGTEDTPWTRTRLDYGMTYGGLGRSWYGPSNYNPHSTYVTSVNSNGGRPLVQCAPLGRLKETSPISAAQAVAVARALRSRIVQLGPIRTWAEFGACVDALPLWEDRDNDGALDGPPAKAAREDVDENGVLTRRIFTEASGSWAGGDLVWVDRIASALGAGEVPGLTLEQRDLLKAMANPNTDVNDFNPDQNLFKQVDKTDLAGITGGFAHTTELALDAPGFLRIRSIGRTVPSGAQAFAGGTLRMGLRRDTTQADFMADWSPPATPISDVFSLTPLPASYVLAGLQPLVSYPEPQSTASTARWANAAYDGQVGLGMIATPTDPNALCRADLFQTLTAETGETVAADLRGPFREPLVRASGDIGGVFPDGIYSEKDVSIKLRYPDVLPPSTQGFVSFWFKPNWDPASCARIHMLCSVAGSAAPSAGKGKWGVANGGRFLDLIPTDEIVTRPEGLFYLPNRNGMALMDPGSVAAHSYGSPGYLWTPRNLVWGTVHTVFLSQQLNYRGMPGVAPSPTPVNRLEGHRWHYWAGIMNSTRDNLGNLPLEFFGGGGWNLGWSPAPDLLHRDNQDNHLRLGEVAGLGCLNYVADATFGGLLSGGLPTALVGSVPLSFRTTARLGRYQKEHGAAFKAPLLDRALRPVRLTWTEIPCDLWFDGANNGTGQDGWMGDDTRGYVPRNDQSANGLRDVRIDLEVWDDLGTASAADDRRLASYSDPKGFNVVPRGSGRLYYKAVFVNEWDATTRANNPLVVTPFLDDVTVLGAGGFGAWDRGDET